MITAVLSSALFGSPEKPSKLSQFTTRIFNAVIESRARSAGLELRRHEAFIRDLDRRQNHSAGFLDQSEPLPVKI